VQKANFGDAVYVLHISELYRALVDMHYYTQRLVDGRSLIAEPHTAYIINPTDMIRLARTVTITYLPG